MCQLEITRSYCNCSPILPANVLRNCCAYNYLPTGTLDGMESCSSRVVHSGLHSFRMARSGIFRSARLFFSDLDANASDSTLFAHLTRTRPKMWRIHLVDDVISTFFTVVIRSTHLSIADLIKNQKIKKIRKR